MIPAVEAHINLSALRHNLTRVRQAAPAAKVMAVIKANGYGHGMIQVARGALADADAFAVARIAEAIELRQAGIRNEIAVLAGFQNADELQAIAEHDLQAVIHQPAQIELLQQTRLAKPIQVWFKIDSGMHRMGVAPEMTQDCWRRLQAIDAVTTIRLLTHLACADDKQSDKTPQQLTVFSSAIAGIDAETSIANSAGVLGWPQSHSDWVRPGIMLAGASAFPGGRGCDEGLQPVMTLRSRLIAVKQLKKGDAIGYGATWTCPEDMPVGVVACGYGDGYPRHAVSGTPVLINNVRTSLVGRVSMDSICIDLRPLPQADIGDTVELWGDNLPVEEVAEAATTIPYELLCSVSRRVQFQYVD